MREPASIFEGELDISDFGPKTDAPAKPRPEIRETAEAQNFPSREPKPKLPKKADRRYRTGRNVNLSAKVSERCNELIYGIHDANRDAQGNPKWTIGQIIEFGAAALKRDLDSGKTPE